MMRWIVATSLRFRYLVVFVTAVLMFFGFIRIRNMPLDVFPEFAPPRVEIQTPCLGLSSAEVESLVTVPLEQVLNGTPGLDIMRSKSVEQLSSIILIFKPGTDLMEARQLVAERLALATPTLPTWAAPPFMLPPLSSTARTMKIGISSQERSLTDLSMVTYWTIRERLLRVRGVANVAIWGERIQMPQVQVDPQRLAANGVSLDDILQTTSDTLDSGMIQYSSGATIGTGGFLETPNQRLYIRHVQPIITPEDLAAVPVVEATKANGEPVVLSDVANVVEDTWPMIGDAVINDGPGLLLIVERFPWANTLEVTNGVEAAIEELRPGLPGFDIDTTIFRPATFIEVALDNLFNSLIMGALLVVLVLLLFPVGLAYRHHQRDDHPVTLVITLLVLSFFGTTVNVMVLAGLVIAIGAVVDDAIVDVENIVRRLRQYRREGSDLPTDAIVLDASRRGARCHRLRLADRDDGLAAGLFHARPFGGIFPAARPGLRRGGTGLAARGADGDAGAGPDSLVEMLPSRERVSPIVPWLHRTYDNLLRRTCARRGGVRRVRPLWWRACSYGRCWDRSLLLPSRSATF